MADKGDQLLDAAARRANRRGKMDAKKRVRTVSRLSAAVASGSAGPRAGNVLDSTVQVLDPALAVDGLRFLVKKELRNTDISHLGRVVLPKKEAEDNLPPLKVKEGFMMEMNDYPNLDQAWKFKYRYWPNNRSRMYILENTGGYVKHHGLKTGDYIVIYKDDINNRYVIRAKKAFSPEDEATAAAAEVTAAAAAEATAAAAAEAAAAAAGAEAAAAAAGAEATAAAAGAATAETAAAAAATAAAGNDELFELILSEIEADTRKSSEMLPPSPNGLLALDFDYGINCGFMQDFAPPSVPGGKWQP